jgi:hypothetical protein
MRTTTVTPAGQEIEIDLRNRRHRKHTNPRGGALLLLLSILGFYVLVLKLR